MLLNKTSRNKTWSLVLGISVALGATPAVSNAALLSGWFGPESAVYQPVAATTAYRPVAVASGCNTCAPRAVTYAARPVYQPTTVLYPTRRAYRQVAAYAPVTTLRPVAACNSCGTQTITMRPVTTYVQRPTYAYRRVYRPMFGAAACNTCTPTYAARPVVTSGCYTGCSTGCSTGACSTGACSTGACSTGACSTGACSTGACGIPTITNYGQSSGCCGTTTSMHSSTIASPVTNYSATTQTYGAPTPAAPAQNNGTPKPDLNKTYQVEPEKKTFKKEPAAEEKQDDNGELQPIPQSTEKSSGAGTSIFRAPKLPNPKDRTARVFTPHYQVQRAVHVQPVAQPRRQLRTDGWSAASE